MEDFSDSTNRTILIIFFLIFYFYLKYIQTSLKLKNNSSNIKCSPLSMIIGGFVDGNKASDTFKKCVQASTSEDLMKRQQQNNKLYSTEIENIMVDISNSINNNQNISKEQQINMIKALNNNNNSIEQIIEKQKNINKTIVESSGPLSDLFNKVGDLSTSLKNTFSKFANSNLLILDDAGYARLTTKYNILDSSYNTLDSSYNTLNTDYTNVYNEVSKLCSSTTDSSIKNSDLCNTYVTGWETTGTT